MRRGIPIILTAQCLLLSLWLLRTWLPASTTGGPTPALQGEAALNHLKGQGLYGSLQEAVTVARYSFYHGPKQGGDWLADNPAQRLSARLTPDGLHVVTGGDEGGSHRLGIKLRSAGYGERQMAAKAGRLTASGARAKIHHELTQSQNTNSQSAIIEWYHNTAAGLEQGFRIESAPGERRDGERLRVELALEGELRVEAVEGGRAFEFIDDAGRPALRYDHLVVMDGAGRKLESRMAVRKDGDDNEVWIEMDDRDAVWPVSIDPTFSQQALLHPLDESALAFGFSVAISGETVVVGSPFENGAQGSAYVFSHNDGVWSMQQRLFVSEPAAGFGSSVAISGETVVVGSAGASGAAGLNQGAAYVFARSGGVWSQQQKLVASDAEAGDQFGSSVAISGETVVVGSPGADGAGGIDQGSAYVFARSGGVWSQQQKLEASAPAVNDEFGASVAISDETVVVGSPLDDGAAGVDQGSAYVFARSGGVWSQQQKLEASDASVIDEFGVSVAISGDTVVVGAPFDDGAAGVDQGSAYVFSRSGGVWGQRQKLESPAPEEEGKFGISVAISAETVVIGSSGADGAAGLNQGSAYVFARSGGVWSQQQKLEASDAEAGDQFGFSVGISGGTVVVGSTFGNSPSSAYVFVQPAPNTPPTITAASVSRTQDLPASISSIAQVNDTEDTLKILTVTVNDTASATVNGVTVSSISVDASGRVTAGVSAACGASDASFTLRVTDSGGLFAEATLNVTVLPETIPPVIACPVNVVMILPPNTTDTGMVVNYPTPSATDNCDASPTITTSQSSGAVFPIGLTTITVTATDSANNQAMCSFTVNVRYNFSGFFQPVDNPPTANIVNAGSAIPIKFTLSGAKGMNIFAQGFPISQQIACGDGAPSSEIEQTVTAGGSSLSYDAESDTYTYVWKTDESWAGTCRQLIVRLNDGSERVALFKFK
ncbi:MAG: PxKF domain-containing protein [Chloracidobacterium sp.]|nr:PxKF domain-containing protein [Chloracidobacterium sp.]